MIIQYNFFREYSIQKNYSIIFLENSIQKLIKKFKFGLIQFNKVFIQLENQGIGHHYIRPSNEGHGQILLYVAWRGFTQVFELYKMLFWTISFCKLYKLSFQLVCWFCKLSFLTTFFANRCFGHFFRSSQIVAPNKLQILIPDNFFSFNCCCNLSFQTTSLQNVQITVEDKMCGHFDKKYRKLLSLTACCKLLYQTTLIVAWIIWY